MHGTEQRVSLRETDWDRGAAGKRRQMFTEAETQARGQAVRTGKQRALREADREGEAS
ncbi:MAG: hypothetical protein AAGM46_27955 [Cyanobacteria bacterium J06582_2]